MTKNQGPKKRARDTARRLSVPLSEAKTRLSAAATHREGRGLPAAAAHAGGSRFASNHAENLTLVTPSGRTRPVERPIAAPAQFLAGDEVQFYGDRYWWLVQAVGDKGTLVATRRAAFGGDDLYTVVHWGYGWRGPHDSWGHPATTQEECAEVAAALESEADILDMSVRRSVYLDLRRARRGRSIVWEDAV